MKNKTVGIFLIALPFILLIVLALLLSDDALHTLKMILGFTICLSLPIVSIMAGKKLMEKDK